MIHLFEALSFLLAWGYTAVFFLILKSFLPLREHIILKVIAFLVCGFLADSIIYSNDPGSLFGTMLLFSSLFCCFTAEHLWKNYLCCWYFIRRSLLSTT